MKIFSFCFLFLLAVCSAGAREYTFLQWNIWQEGMTYYSFPSEDSGLLSRYPIKEYSTVYPENSDHGSIYRLVAEADGHEFAMYTTLSCLWVHGLRTTRVFLCVSG